jgi:hypothetical protein
MSFTLKYRRRAEPKAEVYGSLYAALGRVCVVLAEGRTSHFEIDEDGVSVMEGGEIQQICSRWQITLH